MPHPNKKELHDAVTGQPHKCRYSALTIYRSAPWAVELD